MTEKEIANRIYEILLKQYRNYMYDPEQAEIRSEVFVGLTKLLNKLDCPLSPEREAYCPLKYQQASSNTFVITSSGTEKINAGEYLVTDYMGTRILAKHEFDAITKMNLPTFSQPDHEPKYSQPDPE